MESIIHPPSPLAVLQLPEPPPGFPRIGTVSAHGLLHEVDPYEEYLLEGLFLQTDPYEIAPGPAINLERAIKTTNTFFKYNIIT